MPHILFSPTSSCVSPDEFVEETIEEYSGECSSSASDWIEERGSCETTARSSSRASLLLVLVGLANNVGVAPVKLLFIMFMDSAISCLSSFRCGSCLGSQDETHELAECIVTRELIGLCSNAV
jgi:hypothetical protein